MKKTVFRFIALFMFLIAICFIFYVVYTLHHGIVFYSENIKLNFKIWEGCYIIYFIIMLSFFTASFFVKNKNKALNNLFILVN